MLFLWKKEQTNRSPRAPDEYKHVNYVAINIAIGLISEEQLGVHTYTHHAVLNSLRLNIYGSQHKTAEHICE